MKAVVHAWTWLCSVGLGHARDKLITIAGVQSFAGMAHSAHGI